MSAENENHDQGTCEAKLCAQGFGEREPNTARMHVQEHLK